MSFNNYSIFNEVQKTFDMGKSLVTIWMDVMIV